MMSSSPRGPGIAGRLALIVLLLLTVATPARSQEAGEASGYPSGFSRHTFPSEHGARPYLLYVPEGLDDSPRPLVVQLHGCSLTAEEMAAHDRFHLLAEDLDFYVVWPEQTEEANGSRCWNWFVPEHQHRDAGEPATIGQLTRHLAANLGIDPRRIHVSGVSAGAAMAVIMTATHPDLYAAGAYLAGCPYQGLPCVASASAIPPGELARRAYEEMGERARVVPFLTFQGTLDPLVTSVQGEQVVHQQLITADLADNGRHDGSISTRPAGSVKGEVPGGYRYEVRTYHDAVGCAVGQEWVVEGMGHVYSGAPDDQRFGDTSGPDATAAVYDWFAAHPMGDQTDACGGVSGTTSQGEP